MGRQQRRRPASVADQLAALYAQVPAVPCRGACHDTCTSFPAPRAEKRIIERATGVDLGAHQPDPRKTTCPLLTEFRQCAVYQIRPLICRLWGASGLFPCNYGCRPEPGTTLVGIRDTYRLLVQAYEISGQTGYAAQLRRVLALPPKDVEDIGPLLKAMAWGRISYDEARRRDPRYADT